MRIKTNISQSKKTSFRWWGMMGILLVLSACRTSDDPKPEEEEEEGEKVTVSITSISPSAAMVGDTVTIVGENLEGISELTIGSTDVPQTIKNTTDSVQFVIPEGSTTDMIELEGTNGSVTSTESIIVIEEHMITTFEDATTDKLLNSAWWDYSDKGPDGLEGTTDDEPWSFNAASTDQPHEGTKCLHVEGTDQSNGEGDWWVGGVNQNNDNTTDPVFDLPTIASSDLYLNFYIKTNGTSAVDIKIRETDGDVYQYKELSPTAANTWTLISVPFSSSDWNFLDNGNSTIQSQLINGIAFDVVTKGSAEISVDVDIDRISFTNGGATTK